MRTGFRLAESAATIGLAAELAHEAFRLPWPSEDPVEPVWSDLIGELNEGDVAGDALCQVAALLVARKSQFTTNVRSESQSDEPFGGWLGRWHVPVGGARGPQPEAYVGVVPAKLDAMLVDLGCRCPDAIYREWKRRGWLLTNSEEGRERTQYSTRINGTLVRVIAIRMTAIEAAGGETANGVVRTGIVAGARELLTQQCLPAERIRLSNDGGVATPRAVTGTSQETVDASNQDRAASDDTGDVGAAGAPTIGPQ